MSGEDAQKRRRIAVIGISSILLVAMVVAATVSVTSMKNNKDEENDQHITSTVKAVSAICSPTQYKEECEESIMAEAQATNTTNPKDLIKIAFNATIKQITEKVKEAELMQEIEKEPRAKAALDTCKQLMNLSIGEFMKSVDTISEFSFTNMDEIFESLKVWLSSTITYQDTCLDAFENTTSDAGKKMKEYLTNTMHMSSNALTMVTDMADAVDNWNVTKMFGGRRLLEKNDDEFPSWAGAGVRRLLRSYPIPQTPNVTVALDGTGDFKNITEALQLVPRNNRRPFVIFIKAGIYHEYVEVRRDMPHVVFVGEGGNVTRITGNKNFIDGINTYRTATVAIMGEHFAAVNIGFENSAGAEKHQAVAVRVQSDKSIFYKCTFDGYQDTLYAHTMRQFYRDCTISGTIDFIFGDSLSVFQNCTFLVRKPLKNQNNIVTAQGRKDVRQPTGIVIQGGSIIADPDFYSTRFDHKNFLARPWKNFSRTVFEDVFIDDLINPEGYMPWEGPTGPINMNTCFYAEYHNYGPGSEKSKRVKWSGVWNLNSKAAKWFSPEKFFHGDDWIEATKIPYFPTVPEHKKHKDTNRHW